ncbi:MAG TPA: hypothetical protein DIT64_18380, partial [Verrucomicrobiales bacterium]|nr:hypothetical protein [Verrucomicrobiales bacterium]
EPAAFAAAVLSLIQDPGRRSRMASTARQWVEAGFSWDRAARQFLELCGSVL